MRINKFFIFVILAMLFILLLMYYNFDVLNQNNKKIDIPIEKTTVNYIPEGFDENYRSISKEVFSVRWVYNEESFIGIHVTSSSSTFGIDTENCDYEIIDINGNYADLFYKEDLVSIVWIDTNLYCVQGNIDKEELIKVAKSINFKK